MAFLISFLTSSKERSHFAGETDEALVIRYRSDGSMEIITELHRRYSHLVLGVCLKYLKNEDAACDAAMQVFEKLIADLRTHKVENFKSWLYTVSKNQCLMDMRKDKTIGKHIETWVENSSEKFVEIWEELHLTDEYDEEKKLRALNIAIPKLNNDQRVCVELFYLKGKTYVEIAELKNMELNSVKSHIQNGKRNLRIILEKMNDVD